MKAWMRMIAAAALLWTQSGCESDTSTDEDAETDAQTDVETEDVQMDLPDDAPDDASDVVEEDGATDPSVLACELADRTFWTWDLSDMPPGDKQVDAVCRGWGEHVAVYVEDAVWGVNMDEDDVVAIVEAFESSTPADPERGIYEMVTSTFGDVPDVDSDPRVILFYHSLGEYMGSSFDGFFRAQDEGTCATCNAAEMLFLDAVHNPVAEPYMLSIIAHEFQHMIHWQADANEHSWVNESMSEAAMALCGYYTDEDNVRAFAFSPDSSLVTSSYVDYGAVFLFGLYLNERLGATFLTELVAESADGVPGFDLVGSTHGVDMNTVFADWVLANYLDDPALEEGMWGYESYDPPNMAVDAASADGVLRSASVAGWAADYNLYSLDGSATEIAIRIDSADHANLAATLVTLASSGAVSASVTAVDLLTESTEQTIAVDASHDRAILVVFALSEGSFTYEHSALW